MQSRNEYACPKCAELWDMFDSATRKYIDLIKEQAEIATTNIKRLRLLDPLIDTAFLRRSGARAAIAYHRVLDHGKEPRTMAAGS